MGAGAVESLSIFSTSEGIHPDLTNIKVEYVLKIQELTMYV